MEAVKASALIVVEGAVAPLGVKVKEETGGKYAEVQNKGS